MKIKKIAVIIGLLTLFAVGCRTTVSGTLEVDGTPFVVEQCRSGQVFGFYGIQLTDRANRRLRLYPNPDGTASAAFFKGDAAIGDVLDKCGPFAMERQSSRINSIHNVRGMAQLFCETETHRISGDFKFENCH